MAKDYYATLGVTKSASQEEIKKAYKKLAKQFHPDINKDKGSDEKFKEINEAVSVLGNDEKRRQYDSAGHSAYTQSGSSGFNPNDFRGGGGFSGGFDVDDIFEMFTGGGFGGGRGRQRQTRGDDLRYDVTVTLEEAASGVTRETRVRKHAPCATCKGKGGKDVKTCSTCHGSGSVRQAQRTPFGVFQTSGPCRNCGGTGQEIGEPCPDCDATGLTVDTKRLEIKIPAGVENGTRLRVQGEGDAGARGAQSGDLYLFITVTEHSVFVRDGADLHLEVPVSFATLALGGEIVVPTIDGEATMKIPKGTQTNTTLRLRGKGIVQMGSKDRGDEYVRLIAKTPEKLTKRQEKALEEFGKDDDEEGWLKAVFKKIKSGI